MLKDEPEDDNIQSYEIVGSLWNQCHRSIVPPPPSNESSSNDNRDHEEMEDINLQSTFEHPLVDPHSKLEIKPVIVREDPSSERKLFGEKLVHDFENLKSNEKVQPSTPKKGTNKSTNLITPSPASKKESQP